jgi:hypothetical protein
MELFGRFPFVFSDRACSVVLDFPRPSIVPWPQLPKKILSKLLPYFSPWPHLASLRRGKAFPNGDTLAEFSAGFVCAN